MCIFDPITVGHPGLPWTLRGSWFWSSACGGSSVDPCAKSTARHEALLPSDPAALLGWHRQHIKDVWSIPVPDLVTAGRVTPQQHLVTGLDPHGPCGRGLSSLDLAHTISHVTGQLSSPPSNTLHRCHRPERLRGRH